MIIDCHAHVFLDPKLVPYVEWFDGHFTFMSAQDQIKMMDAKGVDKAAILPLNNCETPAEHQSIGEILAICEKYPGRFIPFYNVDPRLPRKPELIEEADFDHLFAQLKELGFKGLGEVTARIPWDNQCMWAMLGSAQRHGLSITFHSITEDVNNYGVIDEIGLPGLEKALAAFPELNFLGHSPGFWSEISGNLTLQEKNGYSKEPVKPGGKLHELFRKYPNVHGDLSAGSGLNALRRDPDHAFKFMDEFQDRLLMGLDYCRTDNDMQHIEWLTQIRDEGHISSDIYERITWRNADKMWTLGLQ